MRDDNISFVQLMKSRRYCTNQKYSRNWGYLEDLAVKIAINKKVSHDAGAPIVKYTTTVCGANYQQLAVMLLK